MNVNIISKKERIIYFIWYMSTVLVLTAFFTLIICLDKGYIGRNLLWLIIIFGVFGLLGLIMTYLWGRNIYMLQRAAKYSDYMAYWEFSSKEWEKQTGEIIPETEVRVVMILNKGITMGPRLYTWNSFQSKLKSVESFEKNGKLSLKVIYTSKGKSSLGNKKEKEEHVIWVPVPEEEVIDHIISKLKKANRLR